MSPAAKSKAKDKSSGRDPKISSKHAIASGNTTASAYNPVSGTFHTLESANVAAAGGSLLNGRFKNIDEIEDGSGPQTGSTDCDSVSNNGSCSGESEDQKDKNGAVRAENPPGSFGGNDKREKIRQKNERKHQRQKERRAQELRDRCTGYLMSRKLELLSQQLVGMGFPLDRATMALIINEGRVVDAVNWLLEGSDAHIKEDQSAAGNVKIDISEELARIASMELQYKCARTDVERAVVNFEGDIDKAAEILRSRRQDVSPSRMEEKLKPTSAKLTKDTQQQQQHSHSNGRHAPSSIQVPNQRIALSQVKLGSTTPPPAAHPFRREEKDFNYTKGKLQTPSKGVPPELPSKGVQALRRPQLSKSEWQSTPATTVEKKPVNPVPVPLLSTTTSTVSYTAGSNLQVGTSSCKTQSSDIRHRSVVQDIKSVHFNGREPIVMQQSQSPFTAPVASSGVSSTNVVMPSSGWSDGYSDCSGQSSFPYSPVALSTEQLKGITIGKAVGGNTVKGTPDIQSPFPSFLSSPMDSVCAGWTSSLAYTSTDTSFSTANFPSPLNSSCPVSSSRGFYGGWNAAMSGSSMDWSTASMVNCDYTSIDWSLASPSNASDNGALGFSRGLPSLGRFVENVHGEGSRQHLSGASSPSNDAKASYDSWQGSKGRISRSSSGIGLQEKSVSDSENGSVAFHEWTSPFAGKDIFSLPRTLVPPPSL